MDLHITMKGLEPDETLRTRVEKLVGEVERHREGTKTANVVLERTPAGCAVGVVIGFGEEVESLARHAQASDFEKAFLELERKLEKDLREP